MINLFKVHVPEEVDQPLLEVLHSGYITQGKKVEEFEAAFRLLSNEKRVVTVNSCTSAITLALRLAGVSQGDEVITTAMTCSATNLPILSFGAKPVFADINPITGLIRPADIEGRITPKTKAIIAVDWAGQPVDVKALMEIAKQFNLKVIIDAAHAMGARHNARADFFCYSLQAIKHITTGDGGILICLDQGDYNRAKKLRWFGIDRSGTGLDSRISEDITEWGYKFHMNDLAATIGIEQLKYVKDIIYKQQENAAFYNEHLNSYFKRSYFTDSASYWLYTILLPSRKARNEFKTHMADNGVQVSEVHRRNDHYSVFKEFANLHTPGLNQFSQRMICVPVHWALTDGQRSFIVECCNNFAEYGLRASA